jgi:hypothetical protein
MCVYVSVTEARGARAAHAESCLLALAPAPIRARLCRSHTQAHVHHPSHAHTHAHAHRFRWTSTGPGIVTLDTINSFAPAAMAVFREAPRLDLLRRTVGVSSRCPYDPTIGAEVPPPHCVSLWVPSAGVTLLVQVGAGAVSLSLSLPRPVHALRLPCPPTSTTNHHPPPPTPHNTLAQPVPGGR